MRLTIFLGIFFSLTLFAKELVTPIPDLEDFDMKKVILGERLFHDTRLSADNTVSCASCHMLELGGDDNLPVSFGVGGKTGTRNSPTVLNSRFNTLQFWDGRAKDLEEQAVGPIHNPVEMATNFEDVVKKLQKDKSYEKSFQEIYDDGITGKNITNAIAEFEKSLITPNSKFDRYLKGEKDVLSEDELDGFYAFKEYGCISCHSGVNMGGNLMQKFGVMLPYHSDDLGLFHLTKEDDDRYYFKVPTLRNIDLTAPYYHDGSVETLQEAVELMFKHQVGFPVEEKTIQNVVKFLKTLTGQMPTTIKAQ